MAVMVRAAGIPARVALGYTPGTPQDDGSRLITSDDAHAWVEVFFQGLGWVPFDPTPIADGRRAALPWAPRVTPENLPQQAPALPEIPPELLLLGDPSNPLGPDAGPIDLPVADTASGGRSWPAPAAVALVAAGAAALPAALRLLQRRRRIASGTAQALWDELTATVDDLGLSRNHAWTPREAGGALADRVAASPGAEAIQRLARAEELASYGPATDAREDGLETALHTARRALLGSTDRLTRLQAALWPASLPAGLRAAVPAWARRRPGLPGPFGARRRSRRV
jgi:hypothetical protein